MEERGFLVRYCSGALKALIAALFALSLSLICQQFLVAQNAGWASWVVFGSTLGLILLAMG